MWAIRSFPYTMMVACIVIGLLLPSDTNAIPVVSRLCSKLTGMPYQEIS